MRNLPSFSGRENWMKTLKMCDVLICIIQTQHLIWPIDCLLGGIQDFPFLSVVFLQFYCKKSLAKMSYFSATQVLTSMWKTHFYKTSDKEICQLKTYNFCCTHTSGQIQNINLKLNCTWGENWLLCSQSNSFVSGRPYRN